MLKTLIKNGHVGVADTLGGELISFKSQDGTEYVWTGDSKYWSGHAPVLFPNVGALVNSITRFDGTGHIIPKHGIARKSEFVVAKDSEDGIEFQLDWNEQTMKIYPFRFRLLISHTLTDHGFQTTYQVVNLGDQPMPFCIGGHAGFCCPLESDGSFSDYEIVFAQKEDGPAYYTDSSGIFLPDSAKYLLEKGQSLPLRYEDFNDDVLIFDGLKSGQVKLINRKTGRGLAFDFTGFHTLGVWTPPHKEAPFICLEPWLGLPAVAGESGNFEDKPDVVTLSPNTNFKVGYSMQIL